MAECINTDKFRQHCGHLATGGHPVKKGLQLKSLVASLFVGLFVLSSVGPANAVTGTASVGNLTVTFTVDDATFPGPGCMEAPVRATFSGSGSLEIKASKSGSSNSLSSFSYSDEGESVEDYLQICPNIDGPGVYEIRGTIQGAGGTAPLPSGLSFTVSAAPSKISGLRASQRGSTLSIKGKATAPSDRGQIGAQGEIVISGFLSKKAGGKGKWIRVGTTYADEFGNFTYSGASSQRLKGLKVKAVLEGDGWFSGTSAETVLR